jgi:hypothetical protein
MNPTMTLLYLEANRAELQRRARSRHEESAHLRRVRRTRRWF